MEEEKVNKIRKKRTNVRGNEKSKNGDTAFKNTLIIVLLIVCLIEIIYIIFYTLNLKENTVKKSFLNSYIEIQRNVSTYLVGQNFESYNAYNYAQILTGVIVDDNGQNQKIKDTNDEEILPLVSTENKIDINGVEYFQCNSDNIKTNLKIDMPSYRNITWYIGSNGELKIKYSIKPAWWTSDLDCLIVGN